MQKTCNKHGLTEHKESTDGRLRCKKCRVDYVRTRRRKIKLMAIEYKGGCCQECGYNKCVDALDFHHLSSNEKDFQLGVTGYRKSWEKIKIELGKCILLCANCHREKHSSLAQ